VSESERAAVGTVVPVGELRDRKALLEDDSIPEVDPSVLGDIGEDRIAIALADFGGIVEFGGDRYQGKEVAVALGRDTLVGLRGHTEVVRRIVGPGRFVEDLGEVLVPIGRQDERVVCERIDIALDAEVQQEGGGCIGSTVPVLLGVAPLVFG
jgi:hypothetical protein